LRPPEGFVGKVNWKLANISAEVRIVEPPGMKPPAIPAEFREDPAKRAVWWRQWQQTPEGKAWTSAYEGMQRLRDSTPHFWASAVSGGNSRIDDRPAGNYSLSVRLDRNLRLKLPELRFTIKSMKNDRSDEPLDLGDLTLEN